jgi:hypothetical protein
MNYALGCLLLLFVVLSAGLLLRVEGFAVGDAETTTTTVATLNELKNVSARIAAAIGVLNTSKISADVSRVNTLTFIKSTLDKIIDLVTFGTLEISKSPVSAAAATAFLAVLDDKTQVLPTLIPISPSVNLTATTTAATTAAAAGPSPTNDAVVAKLLESLLATKPTTPTTVPSASSGTQSTPAAATCAAQVAANVKPYSEALDIVKAQNISLQNASVQRCPNMRDYVRKDSIPCYNCSL